MEPTQDDAPVFSFPVRALAKPVDGEFENFVMAHLPSTKLGKPLNILALFSNALTAAEYHETRPTTSSTIVLVDTPGALLLLLRACRGEAHYVSVDPPTGRPGEDLSKKKVIEIEHAIEWCEAQESSSP